jgi:hypothetical protein
MENTYSGILTGHILPGLFQKLILGAPGRMAQALGIRRERYFAAKRIPRGRWAEKNDESFGAFAAAEGIACKPLRAWAMILHENKIRK